MVIFVASTDWLAETRTWPVLRPVIAWFFPHAGSDAAETVHAVVRKLGHLVEYAILGWLITVALDDGRGWLPRHAVIAIALAAGYAVTDELHQHFVLGRTAALGDIAIDTLGAAAGQVPIWAWARRSLRARRGREAGA